MKLLMRTKKKIGAKCLAYHMTSIKCGYYQFFNLKQISRICLYLSFKSNENYSLLRAVQLIFEVDKMDEIW